MANSASENHPRHRGLVWSNAAAGDGVYIRAALLRPTFTRLLDAALEFGVARLEAEWAELQSEPTRETRRAAAIVARIIGNIEKGFNLAARGN
jgi:hypothetical protein